MKQCTFINRFGVSALLLTLAASTQAQQFSGHYPAGAEGIKAASLPPPGIYLRDYNFFYTAGINKDSGLSDFDVTAYVQAPRAIWITDWKIPVLEAQYGMDLLIPFYYSDVKVKHQAFPGGSFSDSSTFSMGDLQFEPLLLSWHWKQFDMGAGYAFWAPTGEPNHDGTRPSRIFSKGYWGNMFTLGGTWYPDAEKTWAISILNRYEINTENDDFKITPGDQYTVDFGISKTITKTIDVGLVGYYQQQVTSDTGPGVRALGLNTDLKDRVVALGPEISAFCPKIGMFASLRYLREFAASDGPEGNKVVLTLTKRF